MPCLGGAPAHIMQHSSGVLISAYGTRVNKPFCINIMFSKDNGKTWDTDHAIYKNNFCDDMGYPATVELKDGSLLTVFYSTAYEGGPAVIMQQKWRLEND